MCWRLWSQWELWDVTHDQRDKMHILEGFHSMELRSRMPRLPGLQATWLHKLRSFCRQLTNIKGGRPFLVLFCFLVKKKKKGQKIYLKPALRSPNPRLPMSRLARVFHSKEQQEENREAGIELHTCFITVDHLCSISLFLWKGNGVLASQGHHLHVLSPLYD